MGENVCKCFYLSTLGLKHDTCITTVLKANSFEDNRGKHVNPKKFSEELVAAITSHIFSFHPSISHYRRAHAPLRLYLPPELNIMWMFQDYKTKNPEFPVSYDSYRKFVKKQNI